MLLIVALLLAAVQLTRAKPYKPDLNTVTMPSVHDLSFEIQRHTLQKAKIGTTISIKLIPFSKTDLMLHVNRLGATDVVPLVISLRPRQKTVVFNSLVGKAYGFEQKKWVPLKAYEEIQVDIHLEESKFFCVINDFWHKSFDYPFQFEKLKFLTLEGYSLLTAVEEFSPEEEDQEEESSEDEEPSEVESTTWESDNAQFEGEETGSDHGEEVVNEQDENTDYTRPAKHLTDKEYESEDEKPSEVGDVTGESDNAQFPAEGDWSGHYPCEVVDENTDYDRIEGSSQNGNEIGEPELPELHENTF